MSDFFPLETVGRVELYTIHPKSGRGRSLTYHVVFLDASLEKTLTFGRGNRLRFSGELEGIPLHAAWQSAPGKGHYVMLSQALLGRAERSLGDEVTIRFRIAADDDVAEPDDLRERAQAAGKLDAWRALTPGARRAWIARIESARREATRIKRLDELLAAL